MPGNLAVDNTAVDGRIRQLRFLPGQPGGNPSINFRGYEDTGFWYDQENKAIVFRFAGTDVYTFDDTGGFSATVLPVAGVEDNLVAFATGGQANATQLSASKTFHRITTCATAADSVKMPAAVIGQMHYVRNDGAALAQLFGLGSDTINGIAAGTGTQLLPGQGLQLFCTTAGAWTTPLNMGATEVLVSTSSPRFTRQSGFGGIRFLSNNSLETPTLQPGSDVTADIGGTALFYKDLYVRRRLGKVATITYSASMTPDASLGEFQEITANNGTAFTINAPTNPVTGQSLNIAIRNTSGGALGVATFNAVFKLAAWTQPANGFNRSIEFYYNGTNWVEYGRCTADVPN